MVGDEKNHNSHESSTVSDLGDTIDMNTFSQILEMDDSEDDRDFSHTIVFEFFDQAEETFERMDTALKHEDLATLHRLGQFLKGSSATLGMTKVKDSCEKIQRFGKRENEDGTPQDDDKLSLSRLAKTLKQVKEEYAEAEATLRKFYAERHAET